MTKHLNYGVYKTTDAFRSIEQHACVCFDDLTLVAVTGQAEDEKSQKYAQLFASAPELLLALETLCDSFIHDGTHKAKTDVMKYDEVRNAISAAREAIRKAGG